MEEEEVQIERTATSGDIIWEMEKNSVSLDNAVRSPRSLQVDDNNKLYIGVTEGVYMINVKKIANQKVSTEGFFDVNDM